MKTLNRLLQEQSDLGLHGLHIHVPFCKKLGVRNFRTFYCIDIVWSEFSAGAFQIAKDAKFLHVDNEDWDQTSWMHRLIWVLVGCIFQKVVFLTLWSIYCLFKQWRWPFSVWWSLHRFQVVHRVMPGCSQGKASLDTCILFVLPYPTWPTSSVMRYGLSVHYFFFSWKNIILVPKNDSF